MIALVVAEWRRMVVTLVRYPMDTVSGMVTLFLVFLGLFYGAKYITQSPIAGGRLDTVVLGYGVWMLMLVAMDDMGGQIQNEAQNGTLEQVMLVPWASRVVFLVRGVMAIAGFLLPAGVVLAALVLITHVHLTWTAMAAVPIVMVLGTAWGLGLLVASVALLLKRVSQMLQILQFLLLFLIIAPVATLPGLGWHVAAMVVPLAAQVALLRDVLNGAAVTHWVWIEAIVNLVVMMGFGLGMFGGADRLARRRGILGHY
jgi:ABC-2 type transport system permease protein